MGAAGEASVRVGDADLASALTFAGDDVYPRVFATSRMIALMEIAASRAMNPHLDPGELSVGVAVDVEHTAPTPRDAVRHARLIRPALELLVPLVRSRLFMMKKYRGFSAPAVACTPKTFAFAHDYAPRPEDVFVATQMKCGTTWMQQIVYEAVCRGEGNLGDDGHRHMYATSPWIESQMSVSLANAGRRY